MNRLGILLFTGFETLDVFGPIEMFGQLPGQIKMVLIAETGAAVQSAQGQMILPDVDFAHTPQLNTILIPGGIGTRQEIYHVKTLNWIKQHASTASLILSVCTGAALLAKAGILDGLEATTNKLVFDWVKTQGPNVLWKKHARWVDAGKVITSSGISAGIDMSLYAISRWYGDAIRDEIATKTEYIGHRDPDNDPFAYN